MKPEPEVRVRRSDWRAALAWHSRLQDRPWPCLLLAMVCLAAAAVMVSGLLDGAPARRSEPVRSWVGAGLWLLGALDLAVQAIRGLGRRKP